MRFVFFSVNDFTKDGGGIIRMAGIMNELIAKGHDVIFISNVNAQHNTNLSPKIQIVNIGFTFSSKEKRVFQALLGFLPFYTVNIFFKSFFQRMKLFSEIYFKQSPIYFFEYLDNSIGYWLFRNGLINRYINDLHGVVPLEFEFQAKMVKSLRHKITFYLKYINSILLDKKVFNEASGLIFASKAMEDFLTEKYPSLLTKKNYILPYLLSSNSHEEYLNHSLKSQLIEKHSIKKTDIIILFSGVFKRTGGVPDLIEAFNKVVSDFKSAKLMLIGDGYTFKECKELVSKYDLQKKVIFIGRTSYNDLSTFQYLADIIVCPDKQNIYSELIIHVKYLDALMSGKVVINGSFKSVLEINKNDTLSLSFSPSNIDSLANTLARSIKDYKVLSAKYKNNKVFASKYLTYKSNVEVLVR